MNLKRFWKEAKQVLAFVLAIALFFNGWATYDFSAFAAAGDLTVTLNASEAVYTGDDLNPGIQSVTYNGTDVAYTEENVTWTDASGQTVDAIQNAGVYTVTVTVTEDVTDADGNVTGTETHSGSDQFTVNVLDISTCTVNVNGSYTYTGTAIEPTGITLTYGDTTIAESLYTVAEVANNIDAGNATVKVKSADGNANVTGEATGTFTILPKSLADGDVELSAYTGIANVSGNDQTPSISVTSDGTVLTENADYSVSKASEMIKIGTYDIVVEGIGNYTGKITKQFVISYAGDASAMVSVSGNTYKNDVYAGEVQVTPAAGYSVSETETGTYGSVLRYNAGDAKPSELYLIDSEGNINKVEFPEFTFDVTAPDLDVTAPDYTAWANSKVVTVSADGTGSGYSVYYTKGSKVDLASPINKNTNLSNLKVLDGNLTIEENVHSDMTYYFYAIDDAGNVTVSDAIVINHIDVDAPTISVDPDGTVSTVVDGVYWKTAADLKVPVKVVDETPGLKSIDVDGIANNPFIFSEYDTEAAAELTITAAGEYTISATDGAGNTTDAKTSIIVKQDSKAPVVKEVVPAKIDAYQDEGGVYWFDTASVELTVAIEDEAADGETDVAPYTVFYTTDGSTWETATVTDGKTTVELKVSEQDYTYTFKAVDAAGNGSSAVTVKLGYDTTAATITDARLTQVEAIKADKWINADEFGGVSKVAFSITATDTETGIKQIKYRAKDSQQDYTIATSYTVANGVYTFVTNEEYADGSDYQWEVVVTNGVGIDSSVQSFVDAEGNNLGQIDTTAPSTIAYIKFISDTEGANSTDRGTVSDGKWTSNIFEMAKNGWNKIWGKEEVKFEVYVQDITSGIDSITMSYNEKPIDGLMKVNGLQAFTTGDNESKEGYTVYEGTLTYSGNDGLAVQNFQIESLTDVAGNSVNDKIVLNNAEDTDIIYFDSVNPELVSIVIDNDTVDTESRYLYAESKTAVLTIEERFFAQEDTPVYPTVVLMGREDGVAAFTEVSSTQEWKQVENTYQWQVCVELPLVDGKEMEYQIQMDPYADPSGNLLTGGNSVASDGSFESKIFVVDNAKPELVDYSVNNATACVVDDAAVYKNDTTGDDLTVTFEIDENATDYEKAKENLEVNVYNVETGESVTFRESDLSLSVDGRSHKYSFSYDGEADAANTYYVEIAYKDAVGNVLENQTDLIADDDKEGVYKSGNYIIDHAAPVFAVEYSEAVNVVNQQGEDASAKTPVVGYTAYYNSDIDVTLTFDEKYVHVADTTGSLEHFEFEITKDGTVLTEVSDITWKHDGTIHTAEFTIKAESDHSTDGNYQFVVNYQDCAENLMDVTAAAASNETDSEGIYTSPILVMDTEAPVVTTSYSANAVCTVNDRDYFNITTATFDIEVKDRNIRYGELKTVLSDMKAYDIDETAINDTALAKQIETIDETTVQCVDGSTKGEANVWTLNLPLSTEANYDIPVNYTDLAGNPAVVNGTEATFTEAVTVDATEVNDAIYIQFKSDVKGANDLAIAKEEEPWLSQVLKFVEKTWNKIWGKETIEFCVFVRDEISGVAGLTMSYYGDSSAIRLSSADGLKREADTELLNDAEYVVYSGRLVLAAADADDLLITQFQIDEAVDVATNARGPLWFAGTENNEQIYLDNKAPNMVSVTINGEDVSEKERYYYNKTQKVVLIIEERFMGQEASPVFPTAVLSSKKTNGEADAANFVKVDSTNAWTPIGNEQWQAELNLPIEADSEVEYQITINDYKDGADNALEGTNVDDGDFTSKIFVIDTLAPDVTSYTVKPTTKCTVANAEVRKNDSPADDLTVEFEIDDNAVYYEESKDNLVVDVYNADTNTLVKTFTEAELFESSDRRNHKYSFSYDGEEDTENEFYIEISYRDAADNALTNSLAVLTTVDDDTYRSGNYIIDHVAPVFKVEYNEATNVVNKQGEDAEAKTPTAEYTAYYNEDIDVTLTFDEKYYNTVDDINKDTLEHFVIEMTKDGATTNVPEIKWSHSGTLHTAEFTIKAESDHSTDGNYQFVVNYQDCAENLMDVTAAADSNETDSEGIYTSPILVMDTTAPEVTTSYTTKAVQIYKGRDYFNDTATVFKIEVVDRNIRYKELKTVLSGMKAYDIDNASINGTTLSNEIAAISETGIQCVDGNVKNVAEKNLWTLNLSLQTNANYDIPVDFTDLAGNAAIVNGEAKGYTEYATVDNVKPEFTLSYSITDPANYLEWGYLFAKKKMTVTVTATDKTAGVQTIQFTIIDENGKETVKTQTFEPIGQADYSVSIPLQTDDFKGSIFAEVFDYSTNTDSQKRGHIVESTSKHSSTGTAKITTITSPSRTVGGVDFYNTDVKFKLLLEDTYSGLGSWEYTGGFTLKDQANYKTDAGKDLTKDPTMEIVPKLERTLTLDAQKNNENDILVKASFIDNVGYELSVEKKYNIDVTKPIITVEYDLNEPANGKYYKETRTATVKIRERNFDPADVEFLITSTDGPKPEISSWSQSGSGDDTMNTCTVTFSQDSDYTFSLKFMDMAGNIADYDRVDEFTIDKTIPVATITYDNNSFLNEYYYDASRTATIDILEHNFDPSAIEIMVTADGSTVGVPHISAWASNGDHNIATITFSADAEYTFDIAGMDLALNELEDYTPDHFVVDQTAPELEIFDIEHMSANNGVVRPGIRYYDTNYDKDGTVILMTGYHNGAVEMTGDRKLEANGLELKLDDFAYVQSMDDIYTMEATVYDLAGNSSEASVMFSVNRFGSVYTFDEATEALVGDNGRYYTNQEQDLVITETNVDTLEFKEITCNLNGKLVTLEEGKDYAVSASGNEATWKQYTYKVKAENFTEEGTYILTIYSEDRATNTSDNSSKGKKIEFVIDKTDPSILISGVENNGKYRINSREMTIDIEDNVRISKLVVNIDGVETVYEAAQINEADGKLVINIGSANHWQDITVSAIDAAGNVADSEELRVLVTTNIFIQFFLNKPLFYGTLGGVAALAALLWWFLIGKKKKEDEEEQAQKK